MTAIEIENIHYKAGDRKIISDISFKIEEHETFALLGANGAGKSTLIDIILGDLKPTDGQICFYGKKNRSHKNIGVAYDNFNLFPLLKVKELLKYFSILYRINYKKVKDKYYEVFGMEKIEETYVKKLSQGERKKVSILLSIMAEPSLVILDEPFANLDPTVIDSLWSAIKGDDRTVLYSSHNWELAERISDKICFIKNSNILRNPESPQDILSSLPSRQKIVFNQKGPVTNFLDENQFSYYTHEGKVYAFLQEKKDTLDYFLTQTPLDGYSYEKSMLKDAYLYFNSK